VTGVEWVWLWCRAGRVWRGAGAVCEAVSDTEGVAGRCCAGVCLAPRAPRAEGWAGGCCAGCGGRGAGCMVSDTGCLTPWVCLSAGQAAVE
jgi:hypothetical protein